MGGNRASFEELKQRAVKPKQQPHIGTVGSGAAAFEELKKRAAQQRYEEDSKKVNSDYINSFLGDAHSFLNDSKKGLDTISWASSMDEWERERRYAGTADLAYRANLIGYYLDRNGDAFDKETVSNLRTLLDAYKTDASNLTQGFSDANKYFSQWATEEDYNSFQEQQQNYEKLTGLDLDAAQKEIDELEKELERYTYLVLAGSPDAEKNTELLAMREKYGHDGNIRAMINQKTAFLNQAKRVQEGVRMSGVADPESEFYDPDFDQYSGYVSTVKPYAFGKPGFGDETYEYINNPMVEYNLLLDGGRKSTARELIDANYNAYSADNPHSDGESSYEEKGYAYMTEAEVAIYNYYYAKEGKEAAEKYLDNIQETLNYRSATKQYENIKGKTALELVFATAAGLDQFENGVKNLFRDGDYIAPTNTQILSGMVREDLSDDGPKLPEWMGGASLGQAGYDLITTTSNMAPSILTSTAIGIINPTAGTIAGNLLMGASAAGNAYQEKLNLGYTKEQARSYGLMIGASEVILERLLGGIGKLGGSVLSNTVLKNLAMVDNVLARFARSAGGKILINAGSEALEEGLQSVIEPYLWQAVSGEEASVDWEEALYNALMGFVSGGMFEGFEAVGNTSNSIGGNQQIQSEIPAAEINADIPNVPLKPVQADRNGAEVITSESEDAQQYIQQRAQAASVRENQTAQTGKEAMQTTEKGSEASQQDYEVSERGKAINTKTNQTVELQGFTESGKTLAIKTDSGTVAREDVAYADEDQAVVYESILNLGIRDAGYANALLNLYRDDPGSVSSGDFVNGMVDAFVYGQHGIDVSDLARNATIAKLTPVQRNSAFYIGKQYAGKQTATAEAIARQNRIRARQAAKTADTKKVSAAKGKVYYGYEGKTIDQREGKALTKRQQVGVDFAKRLAASRGMTIYFYESYAKDGKLCYRDENGVEQLADNGFYDPATKAIHIDLNAGDYGRGTVLFTIAHELTHYIKDTAPAQYKKLCSLLMKGYKAKGQSVSELVAAQQAKAKRRGEKLSFDEAYDEVIADSMESILADGRVMELMGDLEDTDKSLADKVKKFFRDIAKLLEDTIDAYRGVKPDSTEGRLVMQMKDIYGQLQEVFAKGVYEGSEAAQAIDDPAADIRQRIKHSRRNFNESVDAIVYSDDSQPFDYRNVFMGETPQSLLDLGFAQLPMTITSKHIYTIANSEGRFESSNDHYHALGAEGVKSLLDDIKKPIVTFVEKDNPQRVVMITVSKDLDGNPVMAAVECSGQTNFNEVRIFANPLVSAFGKKENSLLNYIQGALDDGRMLQADKKRSQEAPSGLWAQCPEGLWSSDFTTNIERFKQNVKRFLPKDKHIRKAWQDIEEQQTESGKRRKSAREHINADAAEQIRQENEQLKEDVSRLREMLKLQRTVTNGTKFTRTSVDAAARLLKQNSGAKGETRELAGLLNDLYEYIAKGEELTWEGVKEAAQPAAQWLLDHVKHKPQRSEYAEDILHTLRTSRVRLDDTQMAEVEYRYGSYNNFRKSMMGSIVFAKDNSMSLDSQWQEWAGMYPDVFDSELSASDMPDALVEIIDRLRNSDTSALEYEYNRDMIEQDLIRQVYDTYWRVSTLKTFADVQQKEINRLKSKHANQMVKLRQDNRDKVEQMKAEHREKLEELHKDHKSALLAQQAEIRKKHEASRKKAVEGKYKTELRGKIRNVVKELNDLLLNGDKKHHVPDNLKKAVAAALDLVNMDTVEAEERAAKYADLIAKEQAKAEPDQDKIDAYTMTMENILRQGEKMGQRLSELHNAYEEIQKSDDADIANAYDPVIAGSLQELAASIGDTSIRNMSAEQLQDVYDMYRMVLIRVRDANKAFLNEKQESIRDLASRVVGEIKRTGGEHSHRVSALDPARKFLWNNLKPVYAFEHLGSETLTEVFNGVRKGEDVWAKDVTEAREYYLDKSRKYGYDSWDFEKKYRFTSASDLDFELTLEQILSLYAYSKREQAHDHLRLGGFVFDSNIETYKEKGSKLLKYKVNTADAHQITPEILAEIIGTLTKEQMTFVDEMQEYLSSTMGAKGNEVTMKMYGVKLFKEKFYFPLKSAKQFMFEQNEVSGEVKLKNSGFTNKVVAKANNPVILSNFMEVWSGHVNDMSMYHAFVLPLEDFNRVFNFNSPKNENQPSVSVKGTIQNAYSPAAVNYVKQLITDLNGGARSDSTTGIINKMMGLFKKGSVFASLSVVVQQPSAIARAAALLDTKYFIGSRVDPKRHKALWEEVKRYAPVAIIKEMGYFDTNMGKSTQDFITGREYSGFTEKMKALVTDSSYRDEILSKAPALADELAWCSIWEAVKRETRAKNPEMDTKGEAFLQKVGERFTEVITKTQVYDSVLSRSANMRSKDTGMKMATAFMAEPTTSINMIADALLQGKRGNKKYARTAIGAVIASQIFNSILVSFVYAARDDDEEKTYWEKYLGTLTGEVFDSLNPLTYIPFIKDIVSIVQGYDVERSDMAVISDLWNAWQKLGNDNVSVYRKVEGFAGSIAQIFGLPVKNIMRDARGIYQTIASFINGGQTTKAGVGYAVKAALPEWLGGEETANQEQLYEAYLSGDQTHLSRVAERYADASAVSSAMRSAIKEHFTTGDISSATAISYLVKYTGMEKDDAYWKVEEWAYENETGEEFGKYNEFFTAVETGRDLKKVIKQYTDNGVELTTLSSQITSHFKPIYETMTPSKRAKISGYLLDAFAQCGVDQEDAAKKLQYWEFLGEQPDSDLNQWQVADYYEFAKPAGISADVYADYCERVNGIDGEGKKERRMTVIDSLPLTDDQKDALYFAEGWAESKLWQAPWHQ